MHFPALLYTCILSMLSLVDCIPIHQDNLKNLVKLQADTIIIRIKEYNEKVNLSPEILIGDPELYPEIPVNKPIQGLGSIVETLTIFQKVLQKLPKGHVNQLQRDLSTLLGYLTDRTTSMRCTPKEPTNGRSLDALTPFSYPITLGHMALDRLKQFTQRLIVNLDQLKIC